MSATGSMSAAVAGVEIQVAGQAIDAALASQLLEVRLESHLMLADTVSIRLADPQLEHIDSAPFSIGSTRGAGRHVADVAVRWADHHVRARVH